MGVTIGHVESVFFLKSLSIYQRQPQVRGRCIWLVCMGVFISCFYANWLTTIWGVVGGTVCKVSTASRCNHTNDVHTVTFPTINHMIMVDIQCYGKGFLRQQNSYFCFFTQPNVTVSQHFWITNCSIYATKRNSHNSRNLNNSIRFMQLTHIT